MSASSGMQALARPSTGKTGLVIVLMSESVLFLTLLGAYAALRSQTDWQMSHTWARLFVPVLNTAILIASAIMATYAQRYANTRSRAGVRVAQVITVTLGAAFLAGQIYEFAHSGMRIDDQALGGAFFALLGFHGLHVAAGLVVLGIGIMRPRFGEFSEADASAIQMGSLFWYYVTAVWLVLFVALYLV